MSSFREAISRGATGISAEFYAGQSAAQLGQMREAIPYLERVVEADEPLPDALLLRYAPPGQVQQQVRVAIVQPNAGQPDADKNAVYATLEISSLAAALLLAELYQGFGRLKDATALMNELLEVDPANDAVRLSLCDLLYQARDYARLIEVASGASPKSSLGLMCHIFKEQAYMDLGNPVAAKEALEAALTETEADDEAVLYGAHFNLKPYQPPTPSEPPAAPENAPYDPRGDPDHPRE